MQCKSFYGGLMMAFLRPKHVVIPERNNMAVSDVTVTICFKFLNTAGMLFCTIKIQTQNF